MDGGSSADLVSTCVPEFWTDLPSLARRFTMLLVATQKRDANRMQSLSECLDCGVQLMTGLQKHRFGGLGPRVACCDHRCSFEIARATSGQAPAPGMQHSAAPI